MNFGSTWSDGFHSGWASAAFTAVMLTIGLYIAGAISAPYEHLPVMGGVGVMGVVSAIRVLRRAKKGALA